MARRPMGSSRYFRGFCVRPELQSSHGQHVLILFTEHSMREFTTLPDKSKTAINGISVDYGNEETVEMNLYDERQSLSDNMTPDDDQRFGSCRYTVCHPTELLKDKATQSSIPTSSLPLSLSGLNIQQSEHKTQPPSAHSYNTHSSYASSPTPTISLTGRFAMSHKQRASFSFNLFRSISPPDVTKLHPLLPKSLPGAEHQQLPHAQGKERSASAEQAGSTSSGSVPIALAPAEPRLRPANFDGPPGMPMAVGQYTDSSGDDGDSDENEFALDTLRGTRLEFVI
jgi:hypothetical protein